MISFKIEKQVVLIYLWLWWITTTNICVKAMKDSLRPGDTLNSNSSLCSKQGKYCLQFSNTMAIITYRCLVISTDNDTRVWMYDRNQPVDVKSAVLSLDYSGVLKIESQNRKLPIIIYSSPQPTNNTMATILDTGNFVLQQLHPNGTKSILWQSFDYPTNDLIPTMKLGVNRKTGHNWSLVSWMTPILINSGEFSLEWEPKQGELNIKKRSIVYWKSGKLKSNGIFENIPANVQHMYQYIIVSNKTEESFSFEVRDGKLMQWYLSPKGRLVGDDGYIANTDMCYGYNNDGGCQKWEDVPTCREPGEMFQEKAGRPSTDNSTWWFERDVTYSYSDCKMRCWKNCSCNGFQVLYDNLTGCIFYLWNSTQDVHMVPNTFYTLVKPTKSTPNSHGRRWIWIGAAIASALLILCPLLLCLVKKKQKYALKDKKTKDLADSNKSYDIKDLEDDFKGHDIKVFNFTSILEATMEFSPENKLGQGGYRPVYKKLLDWKKRLYIIEGIAQGLLYLLKYSRLKIIHRDLKASNILLDENMNAKISDFGMARMFAQQESTVNTNRIWIHVSRICNEGICSTKSDVYSFGVLLLEIICGRKNNSFYDVDRPLNLIRHAWELWNDGEYLQLLDPSLNDTFVPE
ncbi:putative protein kinase RLK-Pelle-DLSV family [Medicago truncatula]|uniref:non-specific serine/threonine protein kinase n=1 Tax=Medicago truncatula TaxID=3880 RepID=A0A396GHR2_MEDTR|nr:putative protein kinase RLK-Pelle-DLSV family [Medicago truncatula]